MIGCPEAEAAVLGALLGTHSSLLLAGYLRQLEAEDFVDPRNRAVFEAMRALVDGRAAVDPVTVLGELRRSGGERAMTDDKSAGVYLADLVSAPPSVGSVGHYLQVVLEHRVRRTAEELGIRLQQIAGDASQVEVVALLREAFAGIAEQVVRLDQRARAQMAEASA